MYKTVREGDASLQYTLLPAPASAPDTMTLRHVLTGRGAARGAGKRRAALCGLRSRPFLLIGTVLVLGCVAILAAALLPVIASATDLGSALESAFTLGGAGQHASVNPNVHHPPGRVQAAQEATKSHERRRRPVSDEEDDDQDYQLRGQYVALVSATEVPRPEQRPLLPRPTNLEEEDEDDDEDDLSDSAESREGVLNVPPPRPAGLPPSLLPQRQPPAGVLPPPRADSLSPLMLDPIMEDGPRAARQQQQRQQQRQHHKTNNGLYTNEDDVDHNILDLTRRLASPPQRSVASTRIFVEALLPSIGGESPVAGPAAPQRRSWIPDGQNLHWTDPLVRKLAFGAGIVVGLGVSLGLVWVVRRRRSRTTSDPRLDPRHDPKHDLRHDPRGAARSVRRETKVDADTSAGPGNTTRELLQPAGGGSGGSDEEA